MIAPQQSPVFAYLRNPSMVDFRGHLSAMFFVSGCNFRCGFCHNAPLMAEPRNGLSWADIDAACGQFRDNWVDAAVISGGEPTLSDELPRLIELFREHGWSVKLDTNGSRPDVLQECLPMLDYVAMDVKAGLSKYPELTGCEDTQAIARSIDMIKRSAADYEFRTTIIESLHGKEQMEEIGGMIGSARRYVIQPFVPRDGLPDAQLRGHPRTSPDHLEEMAELMREIAEEVLVKGA